MRKFFPDPRALSVRQQHMTDQTSYQPLSQIKNRGHWSVQGDEYAIKLNAILAAQRSGLGFFDLRFHFNDTWWNTAKWHVEPSESLDDLYVRRARQLRDKYEILILRFSGGADSTNILRTFVDNDIKLDAVVINLWTWPDSDPWIEPSNIEKRDIAIPFAQSLKSQGADFELLIVDHTKSYEILGRSSDWIFKIDSPRLACVDISSRQGCDIPELEKWNYPETCVISGIDKPWIAFDADKDVWFAQFNDILHSPLSPSPASLKVQEPFYWTADLPELVIKQCHVLKNFYRHCLHKMSRQANSGLFFLKDKKQMIPLLYPKYYDFLEPGPGPLPYYDMSVAAEEARNNQPARPRGYGFDFGIEKSPYYQVWKDGVDLAGEIVTEEFKCHKDIWEGGLKECWTKKYWLGS